MEGKVLRGYGAFGFRKDETELVAAFNEELRTFIGTPEHLELVRPFGFTEKELPGSVSATDLCNPSDASSGGAH